MRYLRYDPQDAGNRSIAVKLHNGFNDMLSIAALAYKEADQNTVIFKRWFHEDDSKKVKDVLRRVVDLNPFRNPHATALMPNFINVYNDFHPYCNPGVQAYTYPESGHWHMCRPWGQGLPMNRDLTCQNIDGYASYRMQSIAMVIMHETT